VEGGVSASDVQPFDPFLEADDGEQDEAAASPPSSSKKGNQQQHRHTIHEGDDAEAASPVPRGARPDTAHHRKILHTAASSASQSTGQQEADVIATYIRNLCARLTREEIELTTWKSVKGPIEQLLGHPMSDEQRNMARGVLTDALQE
jgi:hypothetical protein